MGSQVEIEAAHIVLPPLNTSTVKVNAVFAVTSTSAVLDLTALTHLNRGHFLTLQADGADVFIATNTANSGTVDDTATGSGVTTCIKCPADQFVHGILLPNHQYIVAKTASGSAKLRVWVSSASNPFDLVRT